MTKSPAAALTAIATILIVTSGMSQTQIKIPNLFPFPNQTGFIETNNTNGNGMVDFSGPFFQALGSNGRSCFSCHHPDQGWTISAQGMQLLFNETQGTDPIFNTFDGSNCKTTIDTSTVQGRRQAYSLLMTRAVIRVFLTTPTPLPAPGGADFEVVNVSNPYGCNDASSLSLYRRPLPSTNLKFLSAVLWDGRASTPTFAPPLFQKITYPTYPGTLNSDLAGLVVAATNIHEQGNITPSDPRIQPIVAFETGLYTAQAVDHQAGPLNVSGATGGPLPISSTPFYIGINDPFGFPNNIFGCGTGASSPCTPFTPTIFTLYNAWTNSSGMSPSMQRRASIARGEALFNNTVINITGVGGINDVLGVPVLQGHCGTCHSTPGAGDHSISAPLNIGIADPNNVLGASYLPVFTLKNVNPASIAYGTTVQTTDPGRALISGAWADIGKFKGPILRGLAARAPYFHNGIAQSLDDVVNFYNSRFNIGFTTEQHDDLVAFLSTL
jgi:cytochrome c peroxidase